MASRFATLTVPVFAACLVCAACKSKKSDREGNPAAPEPGATAEPGPGKTVSPGGQPAGEPARVDIGPCYARVPPTPSPPDLVLEFGEVVSATAALDGVREQIRACYAAALDKSPNLYGPLALSFAVDGDGALSQINAGEFPHAKVPDCVRDAVAALRIDPPQGYQGRVTCPIALGLAPIKSLAEQGAQVSVAGTEVRVGGTVVGSTAPIDVEKLKVEIGSKLITTQRRHPLPGHVVGFQADPETPFDVVLKVVTATAAAGGATIGFRIERRGKLAWAYLPTVPGAHPPVRLVGDDQLRVFVAKDRVQVSATRGGNWNIPNQGDARDIKLLTDVLRERQKRASPRTSVLVSAEPEVTYRELADTLTLLRAQGFATLRLTAQ